MRFLFPDVFPYRTFQNFLFPYLYFKFECISNIINELFPFKYPIILETLYFGGIDKSKCIWSGIMCPSIISIHLYLHNLCIMFTISRLYWLNSIFRLYLGVNTIWYLHNHFVCDKLLCLLAIIKSSFLYFRAWTTLILSRKDDFSIV